MEREKVARLARAVSILLAERSAVTQGTQRVLRPLAQQAAWEAACLLEGAGLMEWATWENVSPKGKDAEWRLTGWTGTKGGEGT